jgi:hypothetical protein
MRILITGSRDWTDQSIIEEAISQVIYDNHNLDDEIVIVHGGAVGADMIAGRFALANDIRHEMHVPDWNKHLPDCKPWCLEQRRCKRAGMVRNSKMVRLGADVCLAFIRNGSPGASGCADMAERAGILTLRFEMT